MVICTRRGCGVTFEPSDSASTSTAPCFFHPGAPVFHEGFKSWSCCRDTNKPVIEFDQFLSIKGCTQAEGHSTEKQELPQDANKATTTDEDGSKGLARMSVSANGVETYGAGATTGAAKSETQPLTKTAMQAAVKPTAPKAEPRDPDEYDAPGRIAAGCKCKRTGCGAEYSAASTSSSTRDRSKEQCRYHPGVAVFHEGSKGYMCCKKRVLDFSDFLTIPPCTTAEHGHLFVGDTSSKSAANGSAGAAADGVEKVDCRMDHYETAADVRITFYAKGVDQADSKIELKSDTVELALTLAPSPSGSKRRFERILRPFAEIDPEASTYNITRFKVELVLIKKVPGQSWLTLESGEKAFGYGLTFGQR